MSRAEALWRAPRARPSPGAASGRPAAAVAAGRPRARASSPLPPRPCIVAAVSPAAPCFLSILSHLNPSHLPPPTVAELLRLKGIRHVIFWAEDPTALVAAHFAGAFFGALALPRVTVIEAYTMALHAVQVRAVRGRGVAAGAHRWRTQSEASFCGAAALVARPLVLCLGLPSSEPG